MNTQKLRWKKRKYFIRINCGIMIALLVAILLFMGFPIVSDAEEVEYLSDYDPYIKDHLLNTSGYLDSDLYLSSSGYGKILTSSEYIDVNYLDGDLSNGEYTFNWKDNFGSFDDYNIRFIYRPSNSSNSGTIYYYLVKLNLESYPDLDCKFVFYNDDIAYQYSSFSFGLSFNQDYNGSDPLAYYIPYTKNDTSFTSSFVNPSSITSKNYSFGGGVTLLKYCYSTVQMYGKQSSSQPSYDSIDDSLYRYNYNVPIIGPVIETYPDGSGGEVINNMYMRTADWKFNIPQYWTNTNFVNSNPTDKWGSGNVQFYGLVNDFQKAHVSDYNLKFDYYLQLVGSFDGGVSFAHSYALRGVNYPLSDFLSNNNIYQVGVDYIFTNATDINGNNIYTTLEDLRGGQISQVNFSKWELSCSAHLESGNYISGSIQETYSFLTQISKEVNNTITENNNPYYPPDYDDTSSSNNNNSVVTSKDGQIVLTNYDNDSLVIDNGHDEVINTLYDKLVPDNVTGESGLTQRFLSLTNANKWFTVMTSSLAIFPQEFWTTIYTIFLASLGIIGTAFLLWIVVHIL